MLRVFLISRAVPTSGGSAWARRANSCTHRRWDQARLCPTDHAARHNSRLKSFRSTEISPPPRNAMISSMHPHMKG